MGRLFAICLFNVSIGVVLCKAMKLRYVLSQVAFLVRSLIIVKRIIQNETPSNLTKVKVMAHNNQLSHNNVSKKHIQKSFCD